ncbi:developmental protein-like protein fluG [Setomelanomma holmii]|uniref:Glutamine synthetase n=1 Tax=Setomelanomma holmii TaxID=210430 RepID=A0A9P4HEG8_9PLEO|nr:developmental protein-like protein fluG [Setomelanomma holmii]
MDQIIGPPRPTLEQLRHVANHFPIIDNHAHNLILPTHLDTIPFESITTEAQGRALRDTFKSLSHLRAAKQLRQLYECGEDADWEDILEQRVEWFRSNAQVLHRRCFEGVHAVLIDDGLAEPQKVYPYDSHDEYFQAPSKRIVRIETVAERLMERILRDAHEDDLGKTKFLPDTWVDFMDAFEREIQEAVKDPEVAGFKTVICYRTGLDIEPDYEEAARAVGHPFERHVKSCIRKRTYRVERKPLNDYLVLRTLEILSEDLPRSDSLSKPLQLHTGLGDNDIDLRKANPAYLQQVIEAYPNVPFVLLHSAYPYTQEAGYLATVYRHVYLDIGEVFPMVSRDGQQAILRQALELVPGSKLLYSSDGHWFPETFYLANLQFREVWLELLLEYIEKGDLTTFQAIAMTKDILFNNSNVLYDLHFKATFDEIVRETPKQLTYNTKAAPASPSLASGVPPIPPAGSTSQPATPGPLDPRTGSPYETVPPAFPPPPTAPKVYETQLFDDFIKKNPDTKFIYVQWLDYMATIRSRIIPIKEFARMVREGVPIGISQGNTGTLQNDGLTPAVNTTGQIYIEPDLRSLRKTHNQDPLPSATVLSYWRSESGIPLPGCPRNALETLINDLQYTHAITLLVGFEIEVTFLSRNNTPKNPFTSTTTTQQDTPDPFTPLTTTHAWGTMSPEQWLQLPFLSEIVLALDAMGIEIQQFHAESGPSQYEFILPPLPPLLAIDTVIQARQVIHQIAALHDLRATLHPKPFGDRGAGTAAHAHVSLHPPERDVQFFVGGVLQHLPALCAFTLPAEESYARVVDDAWTGGTWVAWGTQNREVPLRRIKNGRWEIRCLDGIANPYLSMAAIIAAGLLGLQSGVQDFAERDVQVNPSTLDDEGRKQYGVVRKMPASLGEAVEDLKGDGSLVEALGHEVVGSYVVMKNSEQKMLGKMGEGERRVWLIERY